MHALLGVIQSTQMPGSLEAARPAGDRKLISCWTVSDVVTATGKLTVGLVQGQHSCGVKGVGLAVVV